MDKARCLDDLRGAVALLGDDPAAAAAARDRLWGALADHAERGDYDIAARLAVLGAKAVLTSAHERLEALREIDGLHDLLDDLDMLDLWTRP
jgi:hypothetical protein